MKRILTLCAVLAAQFSFAQDYATKTATDKNGETYEYVTNDPTATRIYTLDNGLKVYLAENSEEPRIQTLIAVKAGSSFDPADNTGLAHYLEHMMFKGTSKLGALDWEQEQQLLTQISDLYEAHKNEQDPAKKAAIYAQIDSVSQVAAKLVVAGEYDKVVSQMGATGTNAFTSTEQTVYVNNIPSNELKRWVKLERERFGELVLRLFHTELEAVYEEYNGGQDQDNRRIYTARMEEMFPDHTYGTQTTIGTSEHLKNPSMVAIHEYYNTYYAANNMAVILSGDFDAAEAFQTIKKYWSDFQSNPNLPKHSKKELDPITEVKTRELFGPDREVVSVSYRTDGEGSKEAMMADITGSLLYNGRAGLIDLDINQSQKALGCYAGSLTMNEYGMFIMQGTPRQGQSLEEVKDLLLAEVNKVKNGEFEEWLLEAIINNYRLDLISENESNNRAYTMMGSFIADQSWEDQVAYINKLGEISKEEIVAFANEFFKDDNYVVVYKRTGENTEAVKVEKPNITPIELNRVDQSEYYASLMTEAPEALNPEFVDFEAMIESKTLKNKSNLYYIKNNGNAIGDLNFIFDMGSRSDKELALAVRYLQYLGTDKYSAEELKEEFYKLAVDFGVSAGANRSYIYINGLNSNFDKALALLEDLMANCVADSVAYQEMVQGILQQRMNTMRNPQAVMFQGMMPYGMYGANNPTTDQLTAEQLMAIDPQTLVDKIKELNSYQHYAFYYGASDINDVAKLINEEHNTPKKLQPLKEGFEYKPAVVTEPTVYLVHQDVAQANVVMVAWDKEFDVNMMPEAAMFNAYFGGNMSSIVFATIRESKALAYTAQSRYVMANKSGKNNYLFAYMGTQADKIPAAIPAMGELLDSLPKAEVNFESARLSVMSRLQSERIIKDDIFWTYLSNKDRGITTDYRKQVYEYAETATFDDVNNFFMNNVKGHVYTYMIMADKNLLDMEYLNSLGTVVEIKAEDLFVK